LFHAGGTLTAACCATTFSLLQRCTLRLARCGQEDLWPLKALFIVVCDAMASADVKMESALALANVMQLQMEA
jgi:hypothetical protein